MRERFTHQLEREIFPFKDIITDNKSFVDALYNEFETLPFRPDLNLYTGSKMDLEALSRELETIKPPLSPNKDKNSFTMANFYTMGKLERQFDDLKTEFHKLKVIDKKYLGAFLLDAPTVNTLKELSDKIDLFEKYVIKNDTDFIPYAQRKAKEVIAILEKLNNKDLKTALLKNIINSQSNKEIFLDGIHFDLNWNMSIKPDENKIEQYDTLKGYFNEVLESELDKTDKPKQKKPKPSFNDFDDVFIDAEHKQKAYEILKKHKVNDTSLFEKDSLTLRKGKATELIRLIKRFEIDGYFHKITDTKLQSLFCKKFNSKTGYQNYKQTKAFLGILK